MSQINVIKRNGERVPLDISKIQRQVKYGCRGIDNVSPSMIELKAQIQFADGMSTKTIDELLLKAMVDLIDEEENPEINNVNYQYVAGRQRVSMLGKEVYGEYTPPKLYEIVKQNVEAGMYTSELLEWYSEEEWNIIELFIDHSKDEEYSYAAIAQLCEKYLVQNKVTGKIYETPQVRYAVAAATAFHNEDKKTRLKLVKDYYECASDGHFTLATPVLAGLGTTTKQFSSCVLITSDDTLDSIFAAGEMMAKYASKRAGIGLEIGRIRPVGAPIRNGEIKHTGLIPFLKKWFGDLRSCSQGGIRNASCTVTLPIWHYQFEDFIVLKNNQGTEETRVRQMDYSVVVSKLFWRRYKNDEQITLFDPNDVPDLYEAFYRDTKLFEQLYVKYERRADLKKKSISADEMFKKGILKERTDTGRIYILNIDNVIDQGSFDCSMTPVYQSNLCQEITLPTVPFQRLEDDRGRIALCTLGSENWGAFKNPQEMRKSCRVLVRSLSNLLQYQDFLSIQSLLANQDFEPLGVGITNLAYWHAKRNLKYGSPEALAEVKRWMEHQAYYLTEASIELAEERGACGRSADTWYGRGVFPWERRAAGSNELTDFTPAMDWESLRVRLLKSGIRNATLMAIAPVESSSVVLNSTNGIEMPMELISVKESKAGSFVQVVPEYKRLKARYQLMWDQKDCVDYLKTAAVLAAYVDQSISTNTFYNPAHFTDSDPQKDRKVPGTLIANNLMLGTHWGLKSFYYSLINKLGSKDVADAAPENDVIAFTPATAELKKTAKPDFKGYEMSILRYDLSKQTNYLNRTMFLDPEGPVTVQRYEEVKYQKIQKYEKLARGFFWVPEEISLTKDKIDHKEASDATIKHIFTSNLLRQTALDSIQGRAPAQIFGPVISIPELESLVSNWSFFETNIHSASYSHIIRNVYGVPKDEFNKIHDTKEIVEMASSVGRYYNNLHFLNCQREIGVLIPERDYIKAIWMALRASYALEALRFMVSFATALAMVENKIYIGNGNIISLILQDELLHKEWTAWIINQVVKEDPRFADIVEECRDEVYTLYMEVIEEEKRWAHYLFIKGVVIGLNADIMCDFMDWTAFQALKEIGIKYAGTYPKSNPIPWFSKHVNINKKQVALQETESTNYVIGVMSENVDKTALPSI